MAVAVGHTSATDTASGSVTSLSYSHTATGDNYLIVQLSARANITSPSVTYNSVSMTLLVGPTSPSAGQYAQQWVYGLANPSTGSNTVSISWTGSAGVASTAVSYTNVASVNTPTQVQGNQTYTQTIGSNDMVVGLMAIPDAPSNGTWTPAYDVASTYSGLRSATACGTNHNTGSGSVSVTTNYNGTENVSAGLVLTGTAGGPTNVKTWDGLAIASVKTINGLAIASVKTVNGLN